MKKGKQWKREMAKGCFGGSPGKRTWHKSKGREYTVSGIGFRGNLGNGLAKKLLKRGKR